MPEHHPLCARLHSRAVSVGGDGLDIADLVVLGLHLGSWQRFEDAVRRSLALDAIGRPAPPAEDLHAAATRFRYSLSLVSARDFKAWLDAREVTVAQFAAALGRGLLRERESGRAVDDTEVD